MAPLDAWWHVWSGEGDLATWIAGLATVATLLGTLLVLVADRLDRVSAQARRVVVISELLFDPDGPHVQADPATAARMSRGDDPGDNDPGQWVLANAEGVRVVNNSDHPITSVTIAYKNINAAVIVALHNEQHTTFVAPGDNVDAVVALAEPPTPEADPKFENIKVAFTDAFGRDWRVLVRPRRRLIRVRWWNRSPFGRSLGRRRRTPRADQSKRGRPQSPRAQS